MQVLAIGGQHLTLGLMRQLDVLQAADIEPLGRVRTRPQVDAVELVGVTADGVLAAAVIRPPSWTGAGSVALDHWAHHHHPGHVGKTIQVGRHGRQRLLWLVDQFEPHSTKNPPKGEICGEKRLERIWREEAEDELAEVVEAQRAYESAQRLPLLVLPGVR